MFEDIFGGFDDFSDITNKNDEIVTYTPINNESNTATVWSTKDCLWNNHDSDKLWKTDVDESKVW